MAWLLGLGPGSPPDRRPVLRVSASTPWRETKRALLRFAHPPHGIGDIVLVVPDAPEGPYGESIRLTVMDPEAWFQKRTNPPLDDRGPISPGLHLRLDPEDGRVHATFCSSEIGTRERWIAELRSRFLPWFEKFMAPPGERVGAVFLEPDVPTGSLAGAAATLRSIGVDRLDFDHILPTSWEVYDLLEKVEGLPPGDAAPILTGAFDRMGRPRYWKERTHEDSVADQALMKLVALGAGAVPALSDALHDHRAVVRERAASTLLRIGPPDSLPALDALIDAFAYEGNASLAVGEMGRAAVPRLLEALDRPEDGVRRRAASLLADLAPKEAIPAFWRALRDVDPGVRNIAATVLEGEKPASPDDRAALEASLRDPDPHVRIQATVDWLAAGGSPARVRHFVGMALRYGDSFVRPVAERACALMGKTPPRERRPR